MAGQPDKKVSVPVPTPLHLLQTLTRTLNDHLANACNQVQADAQKALDKLEHEQQKLAEKLKQAQEKQAATNTEHDGTSSDTLQNRIEQLTERMSELTQTHKDAEQYNRQLQNDVRQTLRLAKGLERIDLQVTQSIEKRNTPASAGTNKRTPTRRSRSRKPSTTATPTADPPSS